MIIYKYVTTLQEWHRFRAFQVIVTHVNDIIVTHILDSVTLRSLRSLSKTSCKVFFLS